MKSTKLQVDPFKTGEVLPMECIGCKKSTVERLGRKKVYRCPLHGKNATLGETFQCSDFVARKAKKTDNKSCTEVRKHYNKLVKEWTKPGVPVFDVQASAMTLVWMTDCETCRAHHKSCAWYEETMRPLEM